MLIVASQFCVAMYINFMGIGYLMINVNHVV